MSVKYLLTITALFFYLGVRCQGKVTGIITDGKSEAIGFCHVFNQTLGIGKISDMNGRFEVIARKNDTLEFSYVGYKSLYLTVNSEHLVHYVKINLTQDSVLLPSITVYADREYKVPLRDINEPMFIPGASLVDPPPPVKPGDLHFGSTGADGVPVPAIGIEGPITYFSREAREKRKAERAYAETRATITYQKFIAQDTVRQQLCGLFDITTQEYDEILVRLNEQFPDIQRTYYTDEIWAWLLDHFGRMAPIVKDYR